MTSLASVLIAPLAALMEVGASPSTMPPAPVIFEDPVVGSEIADRCAKTGSKETCEIVSRAAVQRLASAYGSPASTDDQRRKMLGLLDSDRVDGDVDWLDLASKYFKWREDVTGYRVSEPTNRPLTSSTVETRCWSSGAYRRSGSYYSSCTTTVR